MRHSLIISPSRPSVSYRGGDLEIVRSIIHCTSSFSSAGVRILVAFVGLMACFLASVDTVIQGSTGDVECNGSGVASVSTTLTLFVHHVAHITFRLIGPDSRKLVCRLQKYY